MKVLLIALSLCLSINLSADTNSPRKLYIEKFKDIAMREMREYGIPASITLAQGILESGDGNSRLASKGNNHFGIKCHGSWQGKKMYHDDDAKGECFRVYKDAEQSYRDHSLFLANRSRYAFLFELEPDDYKGWAKGLKKAGYATNPKYAPLLIKIIEENQLYIYDQLVLNGGAEEDYFAQKPDRKKERPSLVKDPATVELDLSAKMQVYEHANDIKYIVVANGVDYQDIEQQFNVWDWEIRKYNGLAASYTPQLGDTLFIQPKRRKSRVAEKYVVKGRESLKQISDKTGVKEKWILKRNNLAENYRPKAGDELLLKGRKRE